MTIQWDKFEWNIKKQQKDIEDCTFPAFMFPCCIHILCFHVSFKFMFPTLLSFDLFLSFQNFIFFLFFFSTLMFSIYHYHHYDNCLIICEKHKFSKKCEKIKCGKDRFFQFFLFLKILKICFRTYIFTLLLPAIHSFKS